MPITLTRSDLKTMVSGFKKVIPRKKTLPVLQHVLVRPGQDDIVEIVAANFQESLVFNLMGQDVGEFVPFLFPFAELKTLESGIRKDDTAVIGPERDNLVPVTAVVGGESISRNVPTTDTADFPREKQIPTTMRKLGTFLAAYRKAVPFASTDETRHVLNGVFFHHEEKAVAGTDGRRLTRIDIEDSPFDRDIIVPATGVLKNGILESDLGGIGVLTEDETDTLEIDTAVWRYQVICPEGVYPNYQHVVPGDNADYDGTVTIHPGDIPLIKAALTQLTSDQDEVVVFCATASVVALLSRRVSEDGHRGQVVLPNSTTEMKKTVVTGINGQFLRECLDTGFSRIRVTGNRSPWLCHGDDVNGLHVMMPFALECNAEEIVALVDESATHEPEGENNVSYPETDEQTEGTEGVEQPQPGSESSEHNPDLRMVETDPVQELVDAVTAAQDAVKQANSALRGIKGKLKAIEKHYRAQEKDVASTRKILDTLKQAAGF
jgi:DNA polymerase III sliding clamp (beta) subunit (PCNA family)